MPEEAPQQRQHVARFFSFDDKDRKWRDRARCRTLDMPVEQRVALFFPSKGGSQKEAKECCAACPVTVECDAYAELSRSFYGIWAGAARRRYVLVEEDLDLEVMVLIFPDFDPIVLVFGEA